MFPLFYFIFLSIFPSSSSFFPFFSPPHTYPYFFFFFISFFPLFPYHFLHTRALTFFSLFPPFVFFATTSHSRTFHTELSSFFLFLFLFSFFLSPFSLANSSTSFFPSIPSKHTNFLGVLLIKTLPSKCIFQIILDINKIKKKKIYRVMCVEEDEERRRRGWCESELQGKAHSREFHQ